MTLFYDNPTISKECQLCMHVDHEEKILYDSYIAEFDYDPLVRVSPKQMVSNPFP